MQQRRTMQSLIVRISLVSCVLVGFLGGVTPAVAQVLPPMRDPSPGSTLTTSTVTFTGGHAGQAGESHWLSVETSPHAADIFHGALGPGHTATVSGLPTSGTLYVRYWTYTPRVGWSAQARVAGWGNQAHTYTMDVGGGGGAGGNHTLRWAQRLDSTNGSTVMGEEGCNSDRFTCIFDGAAVLDNETGLVWELVPSSSARTWVDAISYCATLVQGGRKGWSLPMREQLASLVDPNNSEPALPTGHPFFNVQSASYWSATTTANFPANAWNVLFSNGLVNDSNRGSFHRVWCVRGGPSFDGNTHVAKLVEQLLTNVEKQEAARIAVLPLHDAFHQENKPLGNYLTEKLTNTLYQTGSVRVIERSQLNEVIEEAHLSLSGGFDDASVQRIGKLLGVDAVVVGSYVHLGAGFVEVNSRMVNAETGEIIGVGTVNIPSALVKPLLSLLD